MNNTIIYRPYKSQAWALPFTTIVGPLAFMAAGYCVPYWGYDVLILVAVGVGCVWLTKFLYESLNLAIIFEQNGMQIVGRNYDDYRYIPWEKVSYAYYARSYKGHLFLVLSSKTLTSDQTKKFTNRAANSSRICIDDVVIIHIDFLQNTSQIKELIKNHTLHINSN